MGTVQILEYLKVPKEAANFIKLIQSLLSSFKLNEFRTAKHDRLPDFQLKYEHIYQLTLLFTK